MDGELFMECEEEELEPWQQVYDEVEEDDLEFLEADADNAALKASSSSSSSRETPLPSILPAAPQAVQHSQTTVVNASASPGSGKNTVVSRLTTITPPVMTSSTLPQITVPTVATAHVPAVPSLVPRGLAQGQQLILTQTPSGLGTILLPTPGTGGSNAQPIFLTTQGFPVQNVRLGQNTVNPMGFVLQGQTLQPITLLSGPGGQFFRPAQLAPQVVTQPPQVRLPQVRPPASTAFTTIQIPATLTIRTSQPGSASAATLTTTATSTGTRPTPAPSTTVLPSTSPTPIVNFLATKASGTSPEKAIGSMNQAPVTLPVRGQSQALQVVASKRQANGLPPAATVATPPTQGTMATPPSQGNTIGPSSPAPRACPRCGAHFKMQEALQGHMGFCRLDLVNIRGSSSSAGPWSPSQALGPLAEPPKVVMTVNDFYYGTYEGDRRTPTSQNHRESVSFKCLTCHKKLKDNIRMMNHMKYHTEVDEWRGHLVNTSNTCKECFRQFSTLFQLQCHMENVHGPIESSTKCKICEWAFESEPVFLHHMKNTHKPGEMPYVCQVCEYRSSFYSDVYNHFRIWHEDSRHLLCVYCLKVFRLASNYQQHYLRHQNSKAHHCNKCRLQFVFIKDKQEHKTLHHRSFRKPQQLEGLAPGTKVTIRTYAQNKAQVPGRTLPTPPQRPTLDPHTVLAPVIHTSVLRELKLAIEQKLQLPKPPLQAAKPVVKKSVKKMMELLTKFQEESVFLGKQRCMECSLDVPNFPNHYPTYVHCLLCPYSTCCSRSYADHMINYLKLRCAGCAFISPTGDLMAKHLVQHPDHGYTTCAPKEHLDSDIEFCQFEEEEEEPGRDENVQKPQCSLVEHWTEPMQSSPDGAIVKVPDFSAHCGPSHSLSKNSDAIDYFNLLFPYTLMELIAYETNAHAKACRFLGQCDQNWIPVNAHEIKGFIGLCILMGLQSLPEPASFWSWQHYEDCHTFFRAMSLKRFQQIASNIRMGNLRTEEYGGDGGTDRLHAFRPMLSILGDSMWKAYFPNRCLTIDRALLPNLEADTVSTQGNPKAQPLVWLLCDSKSGYCHRLLIQMGKEKEKERELGFSVVPPLVEGLQKKHHQLFLASSLTSVPLMQKLLEQDVYASSSFPPPSPILPKELWDKGQLEKPGDFLQRQFGPLLATRWKDTKEMCCLSTNAEAGQPDTVWRKSQTKVGELSPIERPLAFRLLQENMRGVDICKQLLACNPLGGLPPDKHWRSLFWFLLNLSIVNSFIVLRESRKDNPPPWVQDGLFSQANFRKRLGHQLAKCAEKYARIHAEIKEETAGVGEKAGSPNKLRHRWVKITAKTKRCRNCNLKNLRHESVYGCNICRVNLCKRASCFWEYHGFSPKHPESPKLGFIMEDMRDTMGANYFGSSQYDDDMDQGMAPVEDMDSEDTEQEEDEEMEIQYPDRNEEESTNEVESKLQSSQPAQPDSPTGPPTTPLVVKEREDTLSARQLRIVLFALCCGIPKAAEHLSTQPQLIRTWLAVKNRQLECEGLGPIRAELAERMVEWVLAQREQQLPLNEENLFLKASEIHHQIGYGSAIRISYDWAVGFMLQHDLGRRAVGRAATVGCCLPRYMEENAHFLTEFTHKHIHAHDLPHTAIAAMDELSVFIDYKMLADPAKVDKEAVLQLVGSGEPLLTIYLAALADGTMLPTLVLFKGQLPDRLCADQPDSVLTDSVLLEARKEGFMRQEALELWASRVWQQHMPAQSRSNKGMLILDGHRGHVHDSFLATLSKAGTLPAVIPAGCTCRLQPLEMCLRPVLQSFLLARWSQVVSKGKVVGTSNKVLLQLVMAWMVEALACLADQPELLKQSFLLTGVLPGQEKVVSPAETQSQLLRTLREALLGSDGLEPELPAELVPENGQDTKDIERKVDEEKENEVMPQSAVEKDKVVGEDEDNRNDKTTEKVIEVEQLPEIEEIGGAPKKDSAVSLAPSPPPS